MRRWLATLLLLAWVPSWAAIAIVGGQSAGNAASATSVSLAYGSDVSTDSLLVIVGSKVSTDTGGFSAGDLTKTAGTATITTLTLDTSVTVDAVQGKSSTGIWSAIVTSGGSLTLQLAGVGANPGAHIALSEFTGDWDASRLEDSATGSNAADNTNAATANATSAGAALFIGGAETFYISTVTMTEGGAWTVIAETEGTSAGTSDAAAIYQIVGTGTTDAADWTLTNNLGWSGAEAIYQEAAAGGVVQVYTLQDTGSATGPHRSQQLDGVVQ